MCRHILFPRAEVLKGLYDALEDVADYRFVTNRPNVIDERIKSYLVIRMPNGIRDKGDTYQLCTVYITLFARTKKSGVEDTLTLDNMQNKVCSLIPLVHPRFTADRTIILGGGIDAGFNYLTIQLTVTINKRKF